ncbi:chaperone NapD [Helicobacter anatolicus]|uniref:chaperone NapD n=1 Tax=Helicobacter anatolicus TaxID=2905874 RepID=UPI001E30D4B5|nr:chaperone NapD [Helicobacter anatolicus]MCE3038160.1 chaperone NapD [Helicobacter anatolicus]
MNISSIIIKAKQEKWEEILLAINAIANAEVALHEKDKSIIIATIEANDTQEEIQILQKIQKIHGILSADMHLTYSESDLKDCKMQADKIAELIDTTPIESMHYSGDIKKFLK